jgi:hypothetical protein
MGEHLMGRRLIGRHLMGGHLMGRHLIGRQRMGRHLMGPASHGPVSHGPASHKQALHGYIPHKYCQTVGLRKEDAELLAYLVDEEKDTYIGVLVLVYHLASRAQPSRVPQLPRCRRISTVWEMAATPWSI